MRRTVAGRDKLGQVARLLPRRRAAAGVAAELRPTPPLLMDIGKIV